MFLYTWQMLLFATAMSLWWEELEQNLSSLADVYPNIFQSFKAAVAWGQNRISATWKKKLIVHSKNIVNFNCTKQQKTKTIKTDKNYKN